MIKFVKKLQKRIEDLKKSCTNIGEGLRNKKQVKWIFDQSDDFPEYFNSEQLRQFFDRSEATASYMEAKDQGTKQDLALAKQQSDLLSAMERDFIARRKTRIQKLADEAVFRTHAGSSFGVFQLNWIAYFESQMRRK